MLVSWLKVKCERTLADVHLLCVGNCKTSSNNKKCGPKITIFRSETD